MHFVISGVVFVENQSVKNCFAVKELVNDIKIVALKICLKNINKKLKVRKI